MIGVALGIAVLVVLFGQRGDLVAARHEFRHLAVGWIVASVLAEGTSLAGFGLLQHRVLRAAGTRIPLPGLVALSLANEAIANTVPAGPALSCIYRYRYYRRRGASEASAGWCVFTVLIAQAVSMALLLLVGVLVAMLASASVGSAGVAAVGAVIVIGGLAVLIRRDLVLRLIGKLVRAAQRVTGHPLPARRARIETALARMQEIPLDARSTAGVVAIAVGVWACDFLCLICSFNAIHATVPWGGVLLAYGAAQAASALPIVPGGLGIVEGSLAVILAAYGVARVPAISAALAYRLVSFWLSIAVGWVSVGMIAYRARRTGEHPGPEAGRRAGRKPTSPPSPGPARRRAGPQTMIWEDPAQMLHPILPDHERAGPTPPRS